MKRSWLGLGLVACLLVAPLAGAYHYSVGAQDTVGVEPSESPGDPDTSEELFQRGLSTDCHERPTDLQQAPDAAAQIPDHDPFCGRLVYHEGTDLTQPSPRDQQTLDAEWTFDVVASQYVGTYELGTCYPWCAPGGVTVLSAAEDGLQTLAPEVFAGDHEDEEDPGHQSYAVDVRLPAAGTVLQRQAGLAQGSGWMVSTLDTTFVGFLFDDQGNTVDDSRFSTIVENRRGAGLPTDAAPLVCGFSPDFDPGGPTEDAPLTRSTASACDVVFSWQDGQADTTFGPDANDRCDSATYVCGALQPAWYGQLACKGWAGCQPAHQAGDAYQSTTDYDVWHFVAAPALSDCNGDQEPGFRTETEQTAADLPFLAHDLDVYTPVTSGLTDAAPGELPQAWAKQASQPARGTAEQDRVDPALAAHDAIEASDAPAPAQDAYRAVHKQPTPEPNAEGDTSKSITIERGEGSCGEIGASGEEVLDPWVDQIDTRQRYQTWNGANLHQIEPYLNTREDQDQNNRPGPGFYLTDGKVGMFTDKDDDGRYDQAPPETVFTDIPSVGAYPMFYDMHLDENLEPSGGCVADFAQKPIADAMAEAGYGPRTGLIEAIHVKEPTALFDRRTNEVHPFPQGNMVFVAKTQAIKALEEAGDPAVVSAIEDTIEATGAPDDANVVDIDDVNSQASDFWEQCGEETGRYVQEMAVYHDCTLNCSGDTIATTYLFQVTDPDGVIGGGGIPAFQPNGQEAYEFGQGLHAWTDVDPFDGDPDRNTKDGTPDH